MFHEKFREIAALYPNSPAIIWRGEVITYEKLDQDTDRIAETLKAKGAGPGSVIPVQKERGPEWIAYSLGILKAGAAYASVSPSTPQERLDFIFNDCEANTAPHGAFCVYYTSGSTGAPKGVILSHRGVLALCEAHVRLCGFTHEVRAAAQADMGFDSFLLSTIPVLYAGGSLYLMDDAERSSLVGIHRFLLKNKIDTIFLTTQFAAEYMKLFDNKRLKTLLTGGEALRSYTPRSYTVYNLYGPAECTVYVTAHKLNPGDGGDIPIGTPTGQNRVELIDGEIRVSGPQVAIGYLGYPPFGETYHTGDLAEYAENGELLYRGRIDNMVKISGYRVEPGEVEITLAKHPDLAAVCVAVNHTANGGASLTAYCVPQSKDVTPSALKAFLAKKLPEYMIPRDIVLLEKLPLDVRTGKVNISALSDLP